MAGVKEIFLKAYSTPFHLVDRSPWPILTGLAALQLPLTLLFYIDTGKTTPF